MKKQRHARVRIGVERGYGPRHAFNAQEGSEAVPEPDEYGPGWSLQRALHAAGQQVPGAVKWLADQVRQGLLSDEDLAEIRKDPTSMRAIQAYGGAALAGISLASGGEEGGGLGEPGAVPYKTWRTWKTVREPEVDLPQPPSKPEVKQTEIRVDEAGNHYEKIGTHQGYGELPGDHVIVKPVEAPGSTLGMGPSEADLEGYLKQQGLPSSEEAKAQSLEAWKQSQANLDAMTTEERLAHIKRMTEPLEPPPEEQSVQLNPSPPKGEPPEGLTPEQQAVWDKYSHLNPTKEEIDEHLNWPSEEEPPFEPNVPRYRKGAKKVGVAKGFGPRHAENSQEGTEPATRARDTVQAVQGDTDTVPAMLTPREAVLNRNAAELAGRGNIEQLNSEGNQLAEKGVDLAAKGQTSVAPVSVPLPKDVASSNLMKYVLPGEIRRDQRAQIPKLAAQKGDTNVKMKPKQKPKPQSGSPYAQGAQQLGTLLPPKVVPQFGPQAPAQPPQGFARGGQVGRFNPAADAGGYYGRPSEVPQPARYNPGPVAEVTQPAAYNPGTPAQSFNPAPYSTSGGGGNYNPLGGGGATSMPSLGGAPNPNPTGGFYPPGQGLNKFNPMYGFASGSSEVPSGGIGSPNPQTAYDPRQQVDFKAPDISGFLQAIRQEAKKQGISPAQMSQIAQQFGGLGGGGAAPSGGDLPYDALGGQYASFTGGTPSGYQGGISDIGYPPMLMPNAEYHADKGSSWVGPYDPNYLVQRYARGTSNVPFR